MRLDLLLRLLPLALAPLLVAWLTRTPLDAFGLSVAHPLRDLLVAAPLGLAGFAVATAFAEYLARRSRRWFVPNAGDLAVQTTYYIVLNAPVEERCFRGCLHGGLLRWLDAPLLAVRVAPAACGVYPVP